MIPAEIKSWDGAVKAITGVWRADSLRGRLARGAVWSFVGTAVSQALAFLASIVTARLLGRVHFGEIGMIQSTVGMLGVFAGLGLGLTTTKHVAEFRKIAPRRAENVIALSMSTAAFASVAMAAMLIAGARRAAESIAAPHLTLALQIASPLLVLSTLNGVQNGVLAGLESFKTMANLNLVRGLLSFPLTIIGVTYWGVDGAVAAMVASAGIGLLITDRAVRGDCLRNGLHFRWQAGWGESRILGSFALPALLSGASAAPVTWVANSILAGQKEGYAELGLLNAANQCRTLAMFLPATILQAALPLLSSFAAESEVDSAFGRVLEGIQSVTVAVVFPLAALMMFLPSAILRLYGPSFAQGGQVVIAVAFTVLVLAAGAPIGPAIQAKGRMWLGFGNNFAWGVTTLLFVWFTAHRLGALSVAYGTALGYVLTTLGTSFYLRSDLPRGVLRRVVNAVVISILLLVVSSALTATGRLILAMPALTAVSFITYKYLIATRVRHALWSLVACGDSNPSRGFGTPGF